MRKNLVVFFFFFAFALIPLGSFAAQSAPDLLSGGAGGLVPLGEDGDIGGTHYRACDLVELSSNVLNFGVAFSVIVATLMFAYAGILYVTAASNPEQVKKAHKVFGNIFVGLLLVLLAWLIVNIFFSVLTGQGLEKWGHISCISNPTSGAFSGAPAASSISGGGSRPAGGSVAATNAADALTGVHPDLVRLVNAAHACSTIPFVVTSGFRERSSTAKDSRHLYGLAVDVHPIINGDAAHNCSDGGCYAAPNANFQAINTAFQCASQQTGIPYQWGGSSPTFMQGRAYDAEHFQLPRASYAN